MFISDHMPELHSRSRDWGAKCVYNPRKEVGNYTVSFYYISSVHDCGATNYTKDVLQTSGKPFAVVSVTTLEQITALYIYLRDYFFNIAENRFDTSMLQGFPLTPRPGTVALTSEEYIACQKVFGVI